MRKKEEEVKKGKKTNEINLPSSVSFEIPLD